MSTSSVSITSSQPSVVPQPSNNSQSLDDPQPSDNPQLSDNQQSSENPQPWIREQIRSILQEQFTQLEDEALIVLLTRILEDIFHVENRLL